MLGFPPRPDVVDFFATQKLGILIGRKDENPPALGIFEQKVGCAVRRLGAWILGKVEETDVLQSGPKGPELLWGQLLRDNRRFAARPTLPFFWRLLEELLRQLFVCFPPEQLGCLLVGPALLGFVSDGNRKCSPLVASQLG